MRTAFATLALAGLVAAAPVIEKRQTNITDADILNYALTLEHLEATFYKQGLANYSESAFESAGYPAWVRNRVSEIGSQEKTHVDFLTGALQAAGATPVAQCEYAFGVTSVDTFLATASILEGVGVSAYLGAAASIQNKDYLTYAGSVLVVEARHNAWIRSAVLKGDAFPRPFEAPLAFSQVYSLAAPFITSCPSSNPPLPVKAFPTLTVTSDATATVKEGSTITVKAASGVDTSNAYLAFVQAVGTVFTPYNGGSVTVPAGVNGQSFLVLTSSKAVTDDATLAGPAIVEVSETVPSSDTGY